MSITITTNGTSDYQPEPDRTLQLARLEQRQISVRVVGITPLIMEKWSDKARREMSERQQGVARAAKMPKDPMADFRAAQYRLDNGQLGMPATAFKAAIVTGARKMEGLTMVGLKTSLFVLGYGADQLVPIIAEEADIECWTNPVRNATGVADIRHRPRIWPWAAVLTIDYIANIISDDQLVSLIEHGGWGSGIGGWRPSAPKSYSGSFGRFRVAN